VAANAFPSCFCARNNDAKHLLPLTRLHSVVAVTDEGLFGFISGCSLYLI